MMTSIRDIVINFFIIGLEYFYVCSNVCRLDSLYDDDVREISSAQIHESSNGAHTAKLSREFSHDVLVPHQHDVSGQGTVFYGALSTYGYTLCTVMYPITGNYSLYIWFLVNTVNHEILFFNNDSILSSKYARQWEQ